MIFLRSSSAAWSEATTAAHWSWKPCNEDRSTELWHRLYSLLNFRPHRRLHSVGAPFGQRLGSAQQLVVTSSTRDCRQSPWHRLAPPHCAAAKSTTMANTEAAVKISIFGMAAVAAMQQRCQQDQCCYRYRPPWTLRFSCELVLLKPRNNRFWTGMPTSTIMVLVL